MKLPPAQVSFSSASATLPPAGALHSSSNFMTQSHLTQLHWCLPSGHLALKVSEMPQGRQVLA